ncbi:hypothetical protein CPC08DRAFT_705692 [Agrocybe pediades]|nr:hypothetical protein CPC08DRAFT_705692 [Agrocybe pediades]
MHRRMRYPTSTPEEACNGCSQTLCYEPHCSPSKELTAQCTDQCVVIACNDPSHAESICNASDSHLHCDLDCDETIDCTDCHGFDAFLKCCDEYHSCTSDPLPHPSQTTDQGLTLDESLQQFWCECMSGHTTGTAASQMSPRDISMQYQNPPSTTEVGTYRLSHAENTSGPASFSAHLTSQQTSTPTTFYSACTTESTSQSSFPAVCLWDACQNSFSSITELVGHVGTHLSSPAGPSHDISNESIHATQSASYHAPLPCLWGDCSQLTSPDDLELLATHLMYEHLGISPHCRQYQLLPPSTQSTTSTTSSVVAPQTSCSFTDNVAEINRSAPDSKSPSPALEHSCADIHQCKWRDCGETFPSCSDLTAHITNVHVGSGKAHYDCFWGDCTRNGNDGFQSKQKICRHLQSHTGHRPFQCSICHQYFSEAATLQQHIRRHTQEKPYVCDYPGCGKSFAITGALTIHKRTHNGDKPFKCSFCGRGFAESSNLTKHLRTHTGARPYVCEEPGCNKSFARPDQLNRHKGVHRKQIRGVTRNALE